uniref:Uncharacterized protein n=1 Tax=Solanum lycopersicum TaxID=4081 RepID=A0A3Q7H7F0_SOLLC
MFLSYRGVWWFIRVSKGYVFLRVFLLFTNFYDLVFICFGISYVLGFTVS